MGVQCGGKSERKREEGRKEDVPLNYRPTMAAIVVEQSGERGRRRKKSTRAPGHGGNLLMPLTMWETASKSGKKNLDREEEIPFLGWHGLSGGKESGGKGVAPQRRGFDRLAPPACGRSLRRPSCVR